MSTVSVIYQLKTIKVKATPGTPVSEILEKATSHFILDATRFGLLLLNLPPGAKLNLQLSKTKKNVDITIKIQFINSPFEKTSIVQNINNQKTLDELIDQIQSSAGLDIYGSKKTLKFQSISKIINQDDFNKTSLASFGAENNASIRLVFENTNKVTPTVTKPNQQPIPKVETKSEPKSSSKESSKPIEQPKPTSIPEVQKPVEPVKYEELKPLETNEISSVSNPFPTPTQDSDVEIKDAYPTPTPIQQEASKSNTPEPIPKHIYVYKPSESPLPQQEPDDEEYDLTVSHARQYQQILSQKANESYKTKRLRQESKEANKKKITNIEIRIKFPDESNLQVNFTPQETNSDLYKIVGDTLINNDEFSLHIPYPPALIENNSQKLLVNFQSRNLLLFKTKLQKSGPYLKPEYLAKAKSLKEAEEIKLEIERKNSKNEQDESIDSSKISNGVLPKSKTFGFGNSSKNSNSEKDKKVPKWFKFGKK
ncbi:Tether containing UBX domain for GLUT4 [Wickerhamomyces ciferrii]|uniref:Tether containing UBX domain for GLUT4 n=1 Tax=Wickerhamomyces ciferrii (strain ATCC 14091 / BCRC 22168 / CBS 111 / JCM 3599 / NBRC 0793 / NRRL Y-1031 F-60-10) TaxID=1206466 RepID=K0KE51_WICCF|nr:Tether containing UBX domain for GLUT4 [Wickerhamomyces ciferrii]CCH41196.1 Tether containing UBX domain for GLUT4 [Wickerhamomyces ciferrii]